MTAIGYVPGPAVNSAVDLISRTTVKTANYTAVAGEVIPVDISAGNVTLTLPPTNTKWTVAVKVVAASTTLGSTACTLTVTSGFINLTGTTSVPLRYMNQTKLVMCDGTGSVTIIGGDFDKTVNDLLYVGTIYTQTTVKAGDTLVAATIGTTETAFASVATITANSLIPGQIIRGDGFGSYNFTSLGPTQRPRVRIGPAATALASRGLPSDGGAINAFVSSMPNAGYRYELMYVVQSIGASAVLRCFSKLDFVSNASGQSTPFIAGPVPGVPGNITIDTTVDNILSLSDQFSANTAGNTNTLMGMVISTHKPSGQSN